MRIIVRHRSNTGKALESHVIHGNPLRGSMAEYLFLWSSLRQKDSERSVDGQIKMAKARRKFLADHMRIYGCITCGYCGRNDLKLSVEGRPSSSKSAATVDHFIPSCAGGRNVESNFVPCCKKCNRRKGDKIPTEIPRFVTGETAELLKKALDNAIFM